MSAPFTERAPAGFMERNEAGRKVEIDSICGCEWRPDPDRLIFIPVNHDPGDEDPGERAGLWRIGATWGGW